MSEESYAIPHDWPQNRSESHINSQFWLTFTQSVFEVWIASSFSVEIHTITDKHRDAHARGDRTGSGRHLHCRRRSVKDPYSSAAVPADAWREINYKLLKCNLKKCALLSQVFVLFYLVDFYLVNYLVDFYLGKMCILNISTDSL